MKVRVKSVFLTLYHGFFIKIKCYRTYYGLGEGYKTLLCFDKIFPNPSHGLEGSLFLGRFLFSESANCLIVHCKHLKTGNPKLETVKSSFVHCASNLRLSTNVRNTWKSRR